MAEPFDAGDVTWTSVTGETVDSIHTSKSLLLPRPRWQRNLSWLVRKWRYPRVFNQTWDQTWDKVMEGGINFDSNMIRVTFAADGTMRLNWGE